MTVASTSNMTITGTGTGGTVNLGLPVPGAPYYIGTAGTSSTSTIATDMIQAGQIVTIMAGHSIKVMAKEAFERAFRVGVGQEFECELPDGSKLIVEKSGRFRIDDADAKITYKGNNVREFNRFVNASDLVADFISDMGKLGARQGRMLSMPIDQFINWLIVKAAEQDGEEPPKQLPKIASSQPRVAQCRACGRFLPRSSRAIGLPFCSGAEADKYLARIP